MRFFLIAFALTLFLVVSTSQITPPSHSSKAETCAVSMRDAGVKLHGFKETLGVIFKLARSNPKILVKYVESRDTNGFTNVYLSYQRAITECKKITSPSKYERIVLIEAYNECDRFNSYFGKALYLLRIRLERVVPDRTNPSNIAVKNLIESNKIDRMASRSLFEKLLKGN